MAIVAPMQIPAFRTSALRKGCLAFPGNSLLCELPPDKGIAVLPFEVSGVSPDDEALARGAARYIRDSLSRLAPDHSQMCVHLRPDKLAEGVALALEGKIHGSDQGTSVTLVIRESRAAKGSPHPIVLRRLERVFDRQQTPDLVASTLMVIADALELSFPAKEWAAWSRSNPRDADSMVSYLSGLGWLETKAYEQAAKAFNAVINPTLYFNFAPAHVGLGDAHRLLFNRTKDEVSALRARQAYQRAIPLDRDFGFAGAEKSLAELEIATGQLEDAITHYKSALKLWPFDQNVQKRLVSALESGGRVDEAFTVLEQAAKETPRCWLSHNALASLYSRHGRLRDAEASLLEVVRLAPFNATAYHNLAFDYLKLGRYDDAVEMSSKAVEFSGSPLAYSTLGRGFLEKGCQQDALLNLRRAIESDENSFIVWANLADALQQIQPGTSAAAAASVRTADLSRKALESTPNAALQAAQCGLNLARCGRASEAVPYLIRARRDGSLDSGVLLTAAEGLHLASEREKAMDALKTAVERGATPHELKSRAGLAPLLDDARSAGLLTNTTVNDKTDAGGLITQRPAGCPGWSVPGKGLRVN
jgi:tetratricopeptide (TPR) repeat protein